METENTASRITEILAQFGPIGTFIMATAAFIGVILNRKKRSAANAEVHLSKAKAYEAEANADDKYGRLALETIAELRETREQIEFLHQQLRYRGAMEVIARNRTHRMTDECQSVIYQLRDREEIIRRIVTKIEELGIDLGIDLDFTAYRVKGQNEIFGEEDLPLLPNSIVDTKAAYAELKELKELKDREDIHG